MILVVQKYLETCPPGLRTASRALSCEFAASDLAGEHRPVPEAKKKFVKD